MNKNADVFWNDLSNVAYFSKKPADWRIIDRLDFFSPQQCRQLIALDLGCGGGRHTEMLCKKNFRTCAVDINPKMLEATRKRTENLSNRPIIREGTILNTPFSDGCFDIVVTTGVLHQAENLAQYEEAIKELSRVCRDECIVCLNIFTNKVIDNTYMKVSDDYSYITKEGLPMCLLSKELFYSLMLKNGFILEKEYSEDIVHENTGQRAVLRCDFIKRDSMA